MTTPPFAPSSSPPAAPCAPRGSPPCLEAARSERRVAITFEPSEGPGALLERLDKALVALDNGKGLRILENRGVIFGEGPAAGRLAFLFPGQGSQYLGMGQDLAERFPVVRATFEEADRIMEGVLDQPLSDYTWPSAEVLDGAERQATAFRELTRTEITQPAVLAMDVALLRLLAELGYEPDAVIGHSLGEYGACVAAGVLSFEGALRTVARRGTAMAEVEPEGGDAGWMIAVPASAEVVEAHLAELEGYAICANKNCPTQTVVGGSTETVRALMERLGAAGLDARRIPVSHAFHTRVVAPASAPLRAHLETIEVDAPERLILSNVTARPYPRTPDEIRDLLALQVASPVEYIDEVERLYREGVRTFVEVGPKRAQAGFVGAILEGRPHRAVVSNHPKLGGLASLRLAAAHLVAAGHAPFEPRPEQPTRAELEGPGDTVWPVRAEVVCTGVAVGLPGVEDPFCEDAFDRLLSGRSLIEALDEAGLEAQLDKSITRLEKGADGTATFVPVTEREQLIRLAGRLAPHDLSEWGVEERVAAGLDKASRLAVAAGFEALEDASLPLVPRYRLTRSGKKVTIGSALPEALRDETGIVFASAFAGIDVAKEEARKHAEGEDFAFDGRYLLRLIGMGHARFAELLGARGPNTRVNAACASTTQAIAIAEDWIRAGRCRRVIVIGADDATDEHLWPWVGSGFLATGAATTAAEVENAALPFDRRRNGTILGAGAVALVLEEAEAAADRGVVPLADLVGTRINNSAFHATRLDADHIATVFEAFLSDSERRFGHDRKDVGDRAVFVSHETFTPPRGGSAAAEVACLRRAFGEATDAIVMANTKGYTGHPMGAGLEDALAIKMLHTRRVPPIPNLLEPDESLGELRFGDGGETELDYAIRLAAGFGSQVAFGLWRRRATGEERVHPERFRTWLEEVTGLEHPELYLDGRTLKARAARAPAPRPEPPQPTLRYEGGYTVRSVGTRPLAPAPARALPAGTVIFLDDDRTELGADLEAAGAQVIALPAGQDAVSRGLTLFAAARERDDARPPVVAAITSLGGRFGLETPTGSARALTAGATSGFLKALAREWQDTTVRVLDVSDATSAVQVVRELAARRRPIEVGLDGGHTLEATLHLAEPGSASLLAAGQHVLLSGGGRGITARVALELAGRIEGLRFTLLGRTPLTLADAAAVDLDAERERIRESLRASGQRVTPVAVQRALAPLAAQKEIQATLDGLRSLGAAAEYVACDVANQDAVRTMLVGRPPVDLAVHGAGLEDSHLLADKDPTLVERVLRVKVDGARSLCALGPRAFVAFTSVAGRFGNAAQTDYAAANDALARFCHTSGRPALAIDWTAWAEVGMATRGSVATVLGALGVELLPAELGARMAADLILAGVTGEVVAAGALGALEEAVAAAPSQPVATPKVEACEDEAGAGRLIRLDPAVDPYLSDHAIEGTPVLPGVVGMELFARAAEEALGRPITTLEEVRFLTPLKCHRGAPVSAEVQVEEGSGDHTRLTLRSHRTLRTGRDAVTEHFVGRAGTRALRPGRGFELAPEALASEGPCAEMIYGVFFHAGRFQVLQSVPWAGAGALVARGRVLAETDTRTEPLVREAALQAAGLHALAQDGRMRLPAAIARTELHGRAEGAALVVRVRRRDDAPEHHVRYDAEVLTEEGRLLQRLEALDLIDAGPAEEALGLGPARRVVATTRTIEAALAELEAEGGDIEAQVTPEDLAAHDRLRARRRRGEWLAARMAAKSLGRDWLLARFGRAPALHDLIIVKDVHGAPSLVLRGELAETLGPRVLPALSLAHSEGVAIAALSLVGGTRVGIDIERIAPRPAGFAETWLSAAEQELPIAALDGRAASEEAHITALWCIKEATTKALGLGFAIAPDEIGIAGVATDGHARLILRGAAAERFEALGGTGLTARVRVDPRFAICESLVEVRRTDPVEEDPVRLAALAALLEAQGYLGPPEAERAPVGGRPFGLA